MNKILHYDLDEDFGEEFSEQIDDDNNRVRNRIRNERRRHRFLEGEMANNRKRSRTKRNISEINDY